MKLLAFACLVIPGLGKRSGKLQARTRASLAKRWIVLLRIFVCAAVHLHVSSDDGASVVKLEAHASNLILPTATNPRRRPRPLPVRHRTAVVSKRRLISRPPASVPVAHRLAGDRAHDRRFQPLPETNIEQSHIRLSQVSKRLPVVQWFVSVSQVAVDALSLILAVDGLAVDRSDWSQLESFITNLYPGLLFNTVLLRNGAVDVRMPTQLPPSQTG